MTPTKPLQNPGKTLIKKEIPMPAKRLREFMKRKKISQTAMGEMFGRSQANINRYLSGEQRIPQELITLLYHRYSLNSEWIYHGTAPAEFKEKPKKDLVTDISDLKAEITTLKSLVAKMQNDIKILASSIK